MKPDSKQIFTSKGASRRSVLLMIALAATFACGVKVVRGAEPKSEPAWRSLSLISDGNVNPDWLHVGWGGFVVDDGALRTECDPKGLGLLVYKRERLGNCQIRVVFKSKEAKSNAGVYVRIADGILEQARQPGAAFDRGADGKISTASMDKMKASAEREEGPWFAVHRGYEVQIADATDPFHRTGAIYSLAPSSALSKKAPGEWKTMIITLAGHRIFVDLDGQRITSFDPESPDVPLRKQWHEPKRDPKRPELGYIGLQNHDPGDVVWFKEVSVRPWPGAAPNSTTGAQASSPKNIGPGEAEKLLKENKKVIVLDVRTPEEFAAGHIAGATNINFNSVEFEKKLAGLDKTKAYLVHCAAGTRSGKTRELMTQLKFQSIYHLDGGLKAWEKAGKPVER